MKLHQMIDLVFNETDVETLDFERYHHPSPKVQRKMEALYLKAHGVEHNEICRLCRISRATLATYLKEYKKGGIERLKQLHYQGKANELSDHASTLETYFKEQPPLTIPEAQDVIEKLTGIRRSPTQVREFLLRLGMRCRKVGFVPGQATDPDKIAEQEIYKKEQLEPRLQEAKAGKRKVYFLDAAHFIYRAYLGFVWCFERLFIPSPAGRKRFNVLGALDAVTNELITLTNETYINALCLCQLLDKIAHLNQGLNIPITIFLDNARYQKCLLVQGYARSLGIELMFLPSYSPNLNLIERYWKFVKKQCLYSKYYAKFCEFQSAIQSFIDNAHREQEDKLESLLTWEFQSFKNVKFSTV